MSGPISGNNQPPAILPHSVTEVDLASYGSDTIPTRDHPRRVLESVRVNPVRPGEGGTIMTFHQYSRNHSSPADLIDGAPQPVDLPKPEVKPTLQAPTEPAKELVIFKIKGLGSYRVHYRQVIFLPPGDPDPSGCVLVSRNEDDAVILEGPATAIFSLNDAEVPVQPCGIEFEFAGHRLQVISFGDE